MKLALYTSLCTLAIGLVLFADGTRIDGNWTLQFSGGLARKTMGGAEFAFQADGSKLTGTANVGHGWPGKAPISDGKIEGDRISFMVYGELPANGNQYPKMRFTGTIHGDQLKLSMMLFYDKEQDGEGPTEFEGKRDPKK
jgi:hypothetical protein